MSVAPDRRLRTNKPLIGNGLLITLSTEVSADASISRSAYLHHVTAAAPVTLTLSDVPYDQEEHCFVRVSGAADIAIAGNGKNIHGAPSLVMGAGDRKLTIRYDATAGEWLERT